MSPHATIDFIKKASGLNPEKLNPGLIREIPAAPHPGKREKIWTFLNSEFGFQPSSLACAVCNNAPQNQSGKCLVITFVSQRRRLFI